MGRITAQYRGSLDPRTFGSAAVDHEIESLAFADHSKFAAGLLNNRLPPLLEIINFSLKYLILFIYLFYLQVECCAFLTQAMKFFQSATSNPQASL